jgi:large subunit ribosomal protein L9
MKVILREDVDSLGKMGNIIKVSDGHARNFLIPKGLAIEASVKNMRTLEHEKKEISQRAEKERKKAEALLENYKDVTCVIPRKVGKQDKLFGAVTGKDIEKVLREKGLDVDRKHILLEEPLKSIGEFRVKVRLYPGIVAEIGVTIVNDEG